MLLIFGTVVCVLSGTLCFRNYNCVFHFTLSWLYLFHTSAQYIASYIVYWYGLLDINCFQLFMLWKVFFSPTMMNSFVQYISLAWPSWFFRLEMHCSRLFWLQGFYWEISFYSNEFFFYLTCILSLVAFNTLLLFYILSVLTMVCCHCYRGCGTWEIGADKWGRLKSHTIVNFIQSICHFILWGLRKITRIKFSWVQVV